MPCDGHDSAIGDPLPGARHHLPRVRLFEPEDVRDVAVGIVERLPKDEGGAFGGSQPFEQQQNPGRQRLASFHFQPGVGAGIGWFRQPGSHIRLPARTRRLHDVDRQSLRRRREKRRGVSNEAAVRHLPPDPDVLHDVLGLGGTPEHAEGDSEETRTHRHKRREALAGINP
jgi:hypothetical protein